MPRMSKGWEDYIPASGEGRALVEVKGKIGKGANMYRRRGRGRFSGTKRYQRYWIPHINSESEQDLSVQYLSYNEPILAAVINPFGGQKDPEAQQTTIVSAGTYNSASTRVLMTQGNIPILSRLCGTWEDYQSGSGSRWVPLVRMFYWWCKVRQTASGYMPPEDFTDAATGQNVWSASPGEFGALRDLMMRKNVMSWGFRNIRPVNPFNVQYAYNGSGVAGYVARSDPQFSPPNQAFLPMPRIPKKGFMLFPGEDIRCYATPVQFDFSGFFPPLSGSASDPIQLQSFTDVTPGLSLMSAPMFRVLCAR